MNILLVGANDRAAYSIAKSLHNDKHQVIILNDEPHAIQYSRFVNNFFTIQHSFEKETIKAADEICNHLQQHTYDVLIPVHDTALTICAQFKEKLTAFTNIYFVNETAIHNYCIDKYVLWQKCKALAIPVPSSILICSLDDIALLQNIQLPCIAKPISSKVYKDGKIFSYTVKKINTKDELVDFIREKIETVNIMVQEILEEGYGAGYNFLSLNGKVVNAYAHQRINEAWGGGQSTYRKTIPVTNYNLEEYSKRLIENIGWTGIAMIEYRIINNIPYIMEINGRAWGSIELGIFAGCSLPADMVNLLNNNIQPAPYHFRKAVYARNLFNEKIWVLQSKSPLVFIKWLWSLKSSFKKDHIIEDSIFRDFRFRINYAKDVIVVQLTKLNNKVKSKFSSAAIAVVHPVDINATKNIAFICKGNINRSAFAKEYLKKNYPNFHAVDYGTVFEEDRLSPVNAVKAAATFDIDLEEHRSKYLSAQAIENTDIFIIMDKINYTDLRLLNIPADKIFLLNTSGIDDPYGKSPQLFEAVFKKIATSIDAVFK